MLIGGSDNVGHLVIGRDSKYECLCQSLSQCVGVQVVLKLCKLNENNSLWKILFFKFYFMCMSVVPSCLSLCSMVPV